jgi:hypothetical protein
MYAECTTAYDQKVAGREDPYNKPRVVEPMVWLNRSSPPFYDGESAPVGSTL